MPEEVGYDINKVVPEKPSAENSAKVLLAQLQAGEALPNDLRSSLLAALENDSNRDTEDLVAWPEYENPHLVS